VRRSGAIALAAPSLVLGAVAACQCSGPDPEEALFDCRGTSTVHDCWYCDRAGTCVLLVDGGFAPDSGQDDGGEGGGGACALFPGPRICAPDGGPCWEHPLPQGNDLIGVWGTSAAAGAGRPSVWAVGAAGTILHWDGVTWTKLESGTRSDLLSVWTDRLDEAWITGASGTWFRLRLDGGGGGTTTSQVGNIPPGVDLTDVWGDELSSYLWAVGYGGKVYQVLRELALPATERSTSTADLYALHGLATRSTVFAAGAGGQLTAYNTVTGLRTGLNPLPYPVHDLWAAPNGILWVTTREGGVYSGDGGSAWSQQSAVTSFPDIPSAIWGNADGAQLWVRGYDGISHQRSPLAAWTGATDPARLNTRDVWGDPSETVWAVGEKGYIGRWDSGARFDQVSSGLFPPRPTGADLLALQVLGCEAWAAGRNGQLLHRTDAGWSQARKGPAAITSLWAPGPGDLWYGTGDAGQVERIIGGGAPTPYSTGIGGWVLGLSGLGPGAVWAVGEDGGISYWNGMSWTSQASPQPVNLNAVLAVAPDDVWAAGDFETVLHFDGGSWSTWASPVAGKPHFRAIAASGSRVFFAGGRDLFLHDRGSGWSSRSDAPQPLHALAFDAEGRLWAAGAKGTLSSVLPDGGGGFNSTEVPTTLDLRALGYRDGVLLIAGDNNAILDFRPPP